MSAYKKGEFATELNDFFSDVSDWSQERWRSLRHHKPTPNLVVPFKQWVTQNENSHKEVKAWILSLPEESFAALCDQVVNYCNNFELELRWLVEGTFNKQPELKKKLEDAIITYCSACWQAVQLHDHLQPNPL